MPLQGGRFKGSLFRAINPVYAREPLSGEGAKLHGGRFNPKGVAALYTSLDPATAYGEANQVGRRQPCVLVTYDADIGSVFDARDEAALKAYLVTPMLLANQMWRSNMIAGRGVATQDFALRLMEDGFHGLLVPSYASGAPDPSLNLVLWRWDVEGTILTVIDDEDRLGRM